MPFSQRFIRPPKLRQATITASIHTHLSFRTPRPGSYLGLLIEMKFIYFHEIHAIFMNIQCGHFHEVK
jgi:hypothetical protein